MSDPCAVAHGDARDDAAVRTLVAVFASPVSEYLIKFGADLGFRATCYDPADGGALPELTEDTDVIVTNHHRDELGPVLRDILAFPVRWVGVMGNPRHPGPHIEALKQLAVPPEDIDRVHRPVGLNIGSRTPPEIALATLAGLIADRNGRPGGFGF